MQIKDWLKQNHISVADISKNTGVPYSTLNDIVNGKTDIKRVQLGTAYSISEYLGMTVDELVRLCNRDFHVQGMYRIITRNKKYYVEYRVDGVKKRDYLCKAVSDNHEWIETIAKWRYEDVLEDMEIKKWEACITSCP